MIGRLGMYTILLFALEVKYFRKISIVTQIPFYVSEIILTLLLSFI
jgi:hypothetical protein